MLDRRMQYTCGYWKGASTLDQAQEAKLHLICRKLQLQPGMTLLELGGGFGGLAHFAASEYGCQVVSYNISREQVLYGRDLCKGLPVRFEHHDYRQAARELNQFDRVVSVGLCEHIGHKNFRSFMQLAHDRLKDQGLFLLHTIGANESYSYTDPWINKYIFPNGLVPSMAQLTTAWEGLWVAEDWHNFGPDYDKTLMAWWQNFEQAWPKLRLTLGDRFYRMWKYYLMCSAGSFRARRLQLWQIVLSKGDIPAYTPVR
jgi:cyclopropane-fatty-acyl-phospholipid synthase